MPICANPESRRLRIKEGDATVILEIKEPGTDSYVKYARDSNPASNKPSAVEKAIQKRLAFLDRHLIGITAEDADGKPDTVTYIDDSGNESDLNSSVENWKEKVNIKWKIAALGKLDAALDTEEETTIKK